MKYFVCQPNKNNHERIFFHPKKKTTTKYFQFFNLPPPPTGHHDGALGVHQLAHQEHEVHHSFVHRPSEHSGVEVCLATLHLEKTRFFFNFFFHIFFFTKVFYETFFHMLAYICIFCLQEMFFSLLKKFYFFQIPISYETLTEHST